MLISCFAYCSTLNIEPTCFSETSDGFKGLPGVTSEDRNRHSHRSQNLKPNKWGTISKSYSVNWGNACNRGSWVQIQGCWKHEPQMVTTTRPRVVSVVSVVSSCPLLVRRYVRARVEALQPLLFNATWKIATTSDRCHFPPVTDTQQHRPSPEPRVIAQEGATA